MIDQKYNKYTKDSLDDIRTNPKRFWSFLRSKTKSKHIPCEIKFQGNTLDESEVVANYFKNFFHSNFTHVHNTDNLPPINSFINPNISIVQLSVAEVWFCSTTLNRISIICFLRQNLKNVRFWWPN